LKLADNETSLVSCTCTDPVLRMLRHRIAAVAFFGGWTLTFATFVLLVPALPPLKPTLSELSSSNRNGPEVLHRRVRHSNLAKERGTEVEVKERFQL